MKKRVVIAMSGGVDSSVTAAILKEQGCECIGMHLNFWSDPKVSEDLARLPQNKCCTLGGLEDARAVCTKLEIPFYVMNVEREFKHRVVDYFLGTYATGRTPNPCVECNRNIKFGELLSRARELGADFLASGHYARVETNPENGKRELFKPVDREKDQTYFLYHLSQEKLARILFPLGAMKKTQVYELAWKFGLARVAEKPQSQGLCFFSESTPKYFLQRYLKPASLKPGPIVTLDGRAVGTHLGLPLYTIGQRSGLGIGGIKGEPEGEPWYVVRIDPGKNELIVGREKDIYEESFVCRSVHLISGEIPGKPMNIEVRIRHRGSLVPARLEMKGGEAHITCMKSVRSVSPGQAAVFYQGEQVIGGGEIAYARLSHAYEEEKETVRKERRGVPVTH